MRVRVVWGQVEWDKRFLQVEDYAVEGIVESGDYAQMFHFLYVCKKYTPAWNSLLNHGISVHFLLERARFWH